MLPPNTFDSSGCHDLPPSYTSTMYGGKRYPLHYWVIRRVSNRLASFWNVLHNQEKCTIMLRTLDVK